MTVPGRTAACADATIECNSTLTSPLRTLDCHCEIDRLLPWHAEREDASPQTGTGRSQHLDPRQLLQPQTRIDRELAHARFDLRAADLLSLIHISEPTRL